MDLSTLANIATALTVLTAVVFGLIEMRRAREGARGTRRLRSCPGDSNASVDRIDDPGAGISDGTTPCQIEADPRLFQRRPVHSLDSRISGLCGLCADGSVDRSRRTAGRHMRVAWRKLRGYVEYERERAGSQKNCNGFMARRTDRSHRKPQPSGGAHEAYRDWRP